MECLAKRLRERREALSLSREALAERMRAKAKAEHASAVQISHYECDRRTPSAAALRDIAKALRCSADWLLGITEQPERT